MARVPGRNDFIRELSKTESNTRAQEALARAKALTRITENARETSKKENALKTQDALTVTKVLARIALNAELSTLPQDRRNAFITSGPLVHEAKIGHQIGFVEAQDITPCHGIDFATDSTLGPTLTATDGPWPDTGLYITSGDSITIYSGGIVYMHVEDPSQICTPNGITWWPYGKVDDRFNHEALIGKIGLSGIPFLVGSAYHGIANTSGNLYLCTNDLSRADNSGSFYSSIYVNCAAPPTNTPTTTVIPTLPPTTTPPTTPTSTPSCFGRVLVIQICNSNAATDDNFDVTLNGYSIGSLDLSINGIQNGSTFIGSVTSLMVNDGNSGFACPSTYLSAYYFDSSIVDLTGTNTLTITDTQNNNNSNFGTVEAQMMVVSGDQLIASDCGLALSDAYVGNYPLSQTYTFSVFDCCAPCPVVTFNNTTVTANVYYDWTSPLYFSGTGFYPNMALSGAALIASPGQGIDGNTWSLTYITTTTVSAGGIYDHALGSYWYDYHDTCQTILSAINITYV